MSKLPKGWATVTLADVTDYISRGKSPKYTEHSKLPVINQRAIRWSGIQQEYLKYIDPSQFDSWTSERFIQLGDILLNSTGTGTVGRACLVSQKDLNLPKVVDSHVTIVRVNQAIVVPRFLFYWLMSSDAQKNILSVTTGATNQIELSKSAIANIEYPIAPLEEQQRIVSSLDALLTKIDICRTRLETVSLTLKRFRRSVLAAAFSGELTEEWREKNLDFKLADECLLESQQALSIDIAYTKEPSDQSTSLSEWEFPFGWSKAPVKSLGEVFLGRQRSPNNHNGPDMRPYIRAANITWNGLDLSDVKEMNFSTSDFNKYRLEVGDVLINEGSGSAHEVGKPAIWRGELQNCCFQNTVICVRPSEKISEYLYWTFLNAALSGAFIDKSRGIGIFHIGKQRFSEFLVPIPPPAEQDEIVRRVETLFDYADALENRYWNAIAKVEKLIPLILDKAFSGKLVPQDIEEEPASALLERIRSSRANAPTALTRNRRTSKSSQRNKSPSTMLKRKDVKSSHLSDLLKEQGIMSAAALWSASRLEIDDFYEQLKEEEASGLLKETTIDETELVRFLEAA